MGRARPRQYHRAMADTTYAVLRDQLQDERDRLRDQLERLGQGSGARPDFDDNFADSGQVTAERGEVEALAGQLHETLADIEDALGKFDAGNYGECENCHQRIADARLEAMPAARFCINCASQRR